MRNRSLQLEMQRQELVIRGRQQREQLAVIGISAGDALRRLRLLFMAARMAASIRMLWNQFRK